MSPSINELFSAPGSEAEEDFEIDMDKLMAGVDTSIAESTRFRGEETPPEPPAEEEPAPEVPPSPEPAEPPADVAPAEHGGEAHEESPGGTAPLPPATDPLGLLFAEAAQDPAKRDRLLAALADPKPEPTQVATLPEDIEEGTVAARLWQQQQSTQEQITRIAEGQKAQSEALARKDASDAASAAGAEFAARYDGRLDGDDVVRIAQAAGNSGLAARLAAGNENLKDAYLQALESTLWTTESLRAKMLEPAAPKEPSVADEHKAESKPRKRKLTALSSSASPVSAPAPGKSPLETRTDGRLTPQSRFGLVQEMATKLNRANNEGGY